MIPSFHPNCRTHWLRVTLRVTPRAAFGAKPTQQQKLTILIEGLFIEIAKKPFKCRPLTDVIRQRGVVRRQDAAGA
jgi:hypothetical protein